MSDADSLFGARWDAARRAGAGPLTWRLWRRSQARLLYPWAGELLFRRPAPLAEVESPAARTVFEEVANCGSDQASSPPPSRWHAGASASSTCRRSTSARPPAGARHPTATTCGATPAVRRVGARPRPRPPGERRGAVPPGADRPARRLDRGKPGGSAPGWEPYPLSRRLVAWSRLQAALAGEAAGREFWRLRLEPSLRRQAAFLRRNLERDLPNNHLLANFRALAWVGLLFPHWPEAARLRAVGLEGLWGEMRRQVLADGVHDERSVTYHVARLRRPAGDLAAGACRRRRCAGGRGADADAHGRVPGGDGGAGRLLADGQRQRPRRAYGAVGAAAAGRGGAGTARVAGTRRRPATRACRREGRRLGSRGRHSGPPRAPGPRRDRLPRRRLRRPPRRRRRLPLLRRRADGAGPAPRTRSRRRAQLRAALAAPAADRRPRGLHLPSRRRARQLPLDGIAQQRDGGRRGAVRLLGSVPGVMAVPRATDSRPRSATSRGSTRATGGCRGRWSTGDGSRRSAAGAGRSPTASRRAAGTTSRSPSSSLPAPWWSGSARGGGPVAGR